MIFDQSRGIEPGIENVLKTGSTNWKESKRERERERELQSIYVLLNDIDMAKCFFNHRI